MESGGAAVSHELLERLNRGLTKFGWELQKSTPGAATEQWEEGTVMKSELPSELVNTAALLQDHPNIDTEKFLTKCKRYFGKVPWKIITTQSGDDLILSSAEKFGLIRSKGDPGMILNPIPTKIPTPLEKLTIKPVSNEKELADFFEVMGVSFGIPTFALRASYPKIPGDPISLFLGYAEGVSVSCSVLVCLDGIGGIFTVGTRPEARRRGYGEALTWACVAESKKKGCEMNFLQASDMGAPIYEKMGFRQVIMYSVWRKKASIFNRLRALIYWIRLSRKYRSKKSEAG